MSGSESKPVFWVASSRKDLQGLPPEVRKVFGFALWQAQTGHTHMAIPGTPPTQGGV